MQPVDVIRSKRDGQELSGDMIDLLVASLVSDTDGQAKAAAFAMAVYWQGMNGREMAALTLAMSNSGDKIEWNEGDLGGPVVDKHSTGGVGDKVSIVLAPLLAACGCYVPMISGRGLGHTGGTLDKLEALAGYCVEQSSEKLREVVGDVGCAIVGATGNLAPADKLLYAVRDQTATVDSIPLITSSILSKKIAAGIKRLAMDVKVGNGAFMQSAEQAQELSHCLVSAASHAGMDCEVLITDMNSPLGSAAGNALEISECIDLLAGRDANPRLLEVTLALASCLLVMAGRASDDEKGLEMARLALSSGHAAEIFARMVSALGGPLDCMDQSAKHLAQAPVQLDVFAEEEGVVTAIDTLKLGEVVLALGGGRKQAKAEIDHRVGLSRISGIGDKVGPGEMALCNIHAKDEMAAKDLSDTVRHAFHLGDSSPPVFSPVLEKIS